MPAAAPRFSAKARCHGKMDPRVKPEGDDRVVVLAPLAGTPLVNRMVTGWRAPRPARRPSSSRCLGGPCRPGAPAVARAPWPAAGGGSLARPPTSERPRRSESRARPCSPCDRLYLIGGDTSRVEIDTIGLIQVVA